jgi:hypothetical protein
MVHTFSVSPIRVLVFTLSLAACSPGTASAPKAQPTPLLGVAGAGVAEPGSKMRPLSGAARGACSGLDRDGCRLGSSTR